MWSVIVGIAIAYALCAVVARVIGIAWVIAFVESGKPRNVLPSA